MFFMLCEIVAMARETVCCHNTQIVILYRSCSEYIRQSCVLGYEQAKHVNVNPHLLP
eukprot:SAG22_NODE_1593_length_4040_cov_2.951028_2_plen_57_part_00